MNYPQSIPAVRDALLAWTPHPSVADALASAYTHPSPVVQMVQVFDVLRPKLGVSEPPSEGAEPEPVLDRDGLKLLAGVSYQISQNAFFGKGPEAFTTLNASVEALAALPPEEPPAPLTPPAGGA